MGLGTIRYSRWLIRIELMASWPRKKRIDSSHRGRVFRQARFDFSRQMIPRPSALLPHPITCNKYLALALACRSKKEPPLREVTYGDFRCSARTLSPVISAVGGSALADRPSFRSAAAEFLLRPPRRGAPSPDLLSGASGSFRLESALPALDLEPHDPDFDSLFAFGIDPVGGGLPTDVPGDWPNIAQVEKYNWRVRDRLDESLRSSRARRSADPDLKDGTLLQTAIEHRLMHAETLAYLLHNLPAERKTPQAAAFADPRPAPRPRQVTIPAGIATLGQPRISRRFRLGQ